MSRDLRFAPSTDRPGRSAYCCCPHAVIQRHHRILTVNPRAERPNEHAEVLTMSSARRRVLNRQITPQADRIAIDDLDAGGCFQRRRLRRCRGFRLGIEPRG